MRIHSRIQRRPRELFIEREQTALLAMPVAEYGVPLYCQPKVARDHYAQVAKALYSLPTRFIGQVLVARADRHTVRFYDGRLLVKTHARVAPGQRATDPGDFPAEAGALARRDVGYLPSTHYRSRERRLAMTADLISPDLRGALRRLKLGRMLDTLPERLTIARQQKMPHQDFLLLVLSDESARRDSFAALVRAQRGRLDPGARIEAWDDTADVTFERDLLNELLSLRFVESHHHVAIVGPVGVGKTFLAHALGHAACRRGYSVLAVQADQMLKALKHARLDNSHEAELRKLMAVDLLIIDDFGLDGPRREP